MLKLFTIVLVGLFLSAIVLSQPKLATEERLIRVEEGVKNLEKRFDDMNKRIDDMNNRIDDMNNRIDGLEVNLNKRIDELRSFLLWGFGILFAGMFTLIGFVIWDRRTAVAPVTRELKELTKDQEKIMSVMREYAKEDLRLIEIMKKLGLW